VCAFFIFYLIINSMKVVVVLARKIKLVFPRYISEPFPVIDSAFAGPLRICPDIPCYLEQQNYYLHKIWYVGERVNTNCGVQTINFIYVANSLQQECECLNLGCYSKEWMVEGSLFAVNFMGGCPEVVIKPLIVLFTI
jgi:hypothetical protein